MRTQHSSNRSVSPFRSVAHNREFYPGYYAPEESAFLGLFEGKWKAKREARQSDSGSDSDSSGGGSDRSLSGGGGGGGFFNLLGNIFGGTLGLAGAAAPILPALGIGSKSRIKEINAQAAANESILNAQNSILVQKASEQKKAVVLGGVLLLVIVVVIVALRN